MRILAIESSCDESSLAWLDADSREIRQVIHSQVDIHSSFGGVVPDLASREHLKNLPALIRSFGLSEVPTHIAVTHGPGLAGCLALGIATAQALSAYFNVPVLPVNHLHGHAYSPFIESFTNKREDFPACYERALPHLGLIVSGGNTLLFRLDLDGKITILAQTVDDAAGEALDKGAKLLGLGYPGGPLIEKCAQQGEADKQMFPRAFPNAKDMRFSFSGLKTSLRYRLEKLSDEELSHRLPDLCASYQQAVVDALIKKCTQALKQGTYKSMGLSGGVANNKPLRGAFQGLAKRNGIAAYLAKPEYTGDNAGMIAFAAYMRRHVHAELSLQPALPLGT